MAQSSVLSPHHSRCSYCGLAFSGEGYSPSGERRFCCYGCFLVERILGAQGEEGVAAWILLRLGIGSFLAMNVMMLALVEYTTPLDPGTTRGLNWAMLALSVPAVVILGIPFITGAIRELRRGRMSTDALIATGSLVAFGGSAWHVFRGSGAVYFDTATMLLAIVTVGRLLEATAKSRASKTIREMVEMTPEMALVLRDGVEVAIPSPEVRRGDRVIVKPGGRIPADGRILSGECLVEETAFTGESKPRACGPGDRVFGGSMDCDGLIVLEATEVGADSLLSQIHRMVLEAQDRRAPVERLAERVSSVFVPVVWLVALGSIAYWGILRHDAERGALSALAVLVAACPCALGLATPMATCLAIGRAAREGVLIRSGEALEKLPGIRKVFFDKTGTLTENQLSVAGVQGPEPDAILSWAASLEAGCEHAIARAIVAEARIRGVPIGRVEVLRVIPGRGVTGIVALNGEAKRVLVGSASLVSTTDAAEDSLTTVVVGWDGEARGTISLQDRLRPDSREAVTRLQGMGIETAVISGDRDGPTRRLAEELGIERVFSERSPEGKLETIRRERESGGGIAMVGDGINDAPALAEADVGFAAGSGTDLARQAGDVTLLGDDLARIPWVLELSSRTYRTIRRNLIWAFGYNSAAMVLGFLGYVHPLIAATAMVASSVAVIVNTMRLNRP